MQLSDFTDLSFLGEFLSPAGKASLIEKISIVGIVWLLMGRKVATHFSGLENGMTTGFANLTKAVDDMKNALQEVENRHTKRIDALTTRVSKLEDKP